MTTSLTRNRLTPESRTALRKTVRGLRESLIAELKDSAQQRYLLSVPVAKAAASLGAEQLERRRRLEAALDQAAAEDGGGKDARERAFEAAAKEAGATLLNRLVLLRHLEALGLSKPAVLTGGWMSKGYHQFQAFAPALCEDETQGMGPLLELLFAELAVPLPGLFGDVGLTSLLAVAPATLRHVIEALDEVPAEAWCDDLTLGWVYQYWNDPDREALDAKISEGGKVEPHEIASKTQMFTERYMVEWLLQNSLGPTWLAMCAKNGWKAEAESKGVLADLDARRAAWRKQREAGEVAPDALMPIDGPLEEAWKYYVPQPMPAAVVEHAPTSLRDLKLLDPACGSGHFLVVAFDLLVELYREEARHRGETWSDRQLAEWILENNLHGIDIDPRAAQIAAAALYLKARALAKDADPRQVNLVAPVLKLSALGEKDPGLMRLETDIQKETGIPPELTRQLIAVLEGVDHLGSLLKVGDAIDKAIEAHEGEFSRQTGQGDFFEVGRAADAKPLSREAAKKIVRQRLEGFLAKHSGAEDLGLRLRGQQLTAGLRFASIAKEGEYHLVVGNPPYQGTSKMKNTGYVAKHYPMGKSDLYAAFLERGLQFCRAGGASAMVTMRNWMFLSGFKNLREYLLNSFALALLLDLGPGGFEEINAAQVVVSVTCSVFRRTPVASANCSLAFRPTLTTDRSSQGMTDRKRSGALAQVGRYEFWVENLKAVSATPVLYWWSSSFLIAYAGSPKLGDVAPTRQGAATSDNRRFVRASWEVMPGAILRLRHDHTFNAATPVSWVPFLQGSQGRLWIEPLFEIVNWRHRGLELKAYAQHLYGSYTRTIKNEAWYFEPGVAFSPIGNAFSARAHRYRSVIGHKGSSVFSSDIASTVCLMNTTASRFILESLSPGLGFELGDVGKLPVATIPNAKEVVRVIEARFSQHEFAREASVEFGKPGPSAWESVQRWAQEAVDSPASDLIPFVGPEVPPTRDQVLSYLLGVALGRFGHDGEGVLEVATTQALPAGILFISARGNGGSLDHPACSQLVEAWKSGGSSSLLDWLRKDFWAFHRETYENRPIYFPLSSAKRSFVAYVSIHRWTPSTLTKLLSDHLIPERKALEGSLADLRTARASGDKKSRTDSDRQFAEQSKWLEELEDFIAKVTQCAEKGPPPPDASTPAREVDAPYEMDLDDGVMVNAAALWPLLEPMWKDPRKWWKELATAKGRKDYDWAHLSARYFPSRVDEKCQKDPSLAVAHGRFWKYHPEVAYQWELRLQDEIGPDFLIEEKHADALRKAFLTKHPKRAAELQAAEQARRERKASKKDQDELELEAAEGSDDEAEAE